MTPRINYQIEMERELSRISLRGERPRLALHACCAPCSSAVLERLQGAFDLEIYYYNPNIAPESEFLRRAGEECRLVREMNLREARVTVGPYDAARWRALVRGHEDDPEGGERCAICFEMRLRATAAFARKVGADYFTTTLSISPLKDAQLLNAIGARVAQEVGIRYLFSDFKKRDGYKRSIELSAQYGLYRQDYCGCAFSRREREARGTAREECGGCHVN